MLIKSNMIAVQLTKFNDFSQLAVYKVIVQQHFKAQLSEQLLDGITVSVGSLSGLTEKSQ